MSAEIYLKISCPSCNGHVEFPASVIGQLVDCPHCGGAIFLADPKAAFRNVGKTNGPIMRDELVNLEESRLNDMRMAGIKFVEVLGPGFGECAAYRKIQGKKFPIESAPPIPLPACKKKFCKCLYIAVE